MKRFVRAALIGVGALYVVYLVAANVFLSSSLFERIVDQGPQTIWIHFERAWTIFPGRIHARGLQIRGRDAMVEWFLTMDKVDFTVSVTGVMHHRFKASNVDGDEVTFRLRTRLPSQPTSVADYEALPPIPGLGPYGVTQPPVYDAGDWDDHYYHLWTVDLEDVDAQNVRELWVNEVRFAGRAHVQGRFLLKPLRILNVGPATVTIAEGTLGHGPRSFAQGLGGSVQYTLDDLDPRITGGSGMLHHSRIDTDLRVTVVDGGEVIDVPRLALHLNHGVVMAGTRVDAAGVVRRGDERVSAAVIAEAGESSLAFRATGTVDTKDLDLTRATVVGELGGLAVGDPIHAIDAVVTASGRATAGKWTVRADTDGKLRLVWWQFAPDTFVLERLQAALSDLRARGPGFDAAVTALDVAARHLVVRDGKTTLSHAKLGLSGAAGKLGGHSFALLKAGFEVNGNRLDPARPTLRGTDLHLDVEGGELADIAALRSLVPALPFERGRATLSAHIDVRASTKAGGGGADLMIQDASVKTNEGHITGEVRAHLGIKAYHAEMQELDLSGSHLVFDKVAAEGKTGWKGQLDLVGALFKLDRAPSFDSQIELRATDASPFLAVVADKIPGILIGLLRMPNLRVAANVSLAADKLDIEHVEATGGNVQIHGDLRFDETHHSGEFVVKKGILPVNLKIDKDGVHTTVFKGSTARDK